MTDWLHFEPEKEPKRTKWLHQEALEKEPVISGETPGALPKPQQAPIESQQDRVIRLAGEKVGGLERVLNPFEADPTATGLKAAKGLVGFGEGVKQTGLEYFGSPGSAEKYTKMVKVDREAFDEAFTAEFGDKFIYDAAEIAGSAAPLFVIPAGGQTALGRISLAALGGAFASGTQFLPEGGRGTQTAIGAALGVTVAIPLELKHQIGGFLERIFARTSPEKSKKIIGLLSRRSKIGAELEPITTRYDDLVSELADTTNPLVIKAKKEAIANLEKQARPKLAELSKIQGKLAANQLSESFSRRVKLANKMRVRLGMEHLSDDPIFKILAKTAEESPTGQAEKLIRDNRMIMDSYKMWVRIKRSYKGQTGAGNRLINAHDNTLNRLIELRRHRGGLAFQKARKTFGNKKVIEVSNFERTLKGLIDDNSTNLATKKQTALAKEYQRMLTTLQKSKTDVFALNAPGKTSVSEMQALLNSFGEAASGKKGIFKNLDIAYERRPYKMLFGALKDDLQQAGAVSKDLRVARDVWQKYSGAIDALRESGLGKFLGKGPISGDVAFKKFMALQPEEMKTAFKLVRKVDPELARSFQADTITNMIELARQPGAANVPAFSPRKMFDQVRDNVKFKAIFDTAKSKQQVANAIEVTRLIASSPPLQAHAGYMPAVKQMLGVLASRDKTFVARMAGDVSVPRVLARVMFTDDGTKALQMLKKPYNPARAGALTSHLYNSIMANY